MQARRVIKEQMSAVTQRHPLSSQRAAYEEWTREEPENMSQGTALEYA